MEAPAQLSSVLEATPAIAAAWVFGSVARGEARGDSDLDVAVLLRDRHADPVAHRRELADLAARLEAEAGRPVDLVVLGLHDPILAHRVLSEGALVHDADRERRIASPPPGWRAPHAQRLGRQRITENAPSVNSRSPVLFDVIAENVPRICPPGGPYSVTTSSQFIPRPPRTIPRSRESP